jgi:hypothetical protein
VGFFTLFLHHLSPSYSFLALSKSICPSDLLIMQFKTSFIAAVLLIAAPAMAWTVPEDQADGVYSVTEDAAGNIVHIKVGDLPAPGEGAKLARRSRISKRQFGFTETYCDTAGQLPQADTDAANGGLASICVGSGVATSAKLGQYAKSNDVVAFFCNDNSNTQYCVAAAQAQAEGLITTTCQAYYPGYSYDSGAHVTYGYRWLGTDLCNGATDE